MTYTVPVSFIPGTKAKAQEVNQNFLALLGHLETINTSKLEKDFSNISETGLNYIKSSVCTRNIGEVTFSLIPLTDSGLHLMDGAVIQKSGIYSDFVNLIKDLYEDSDNQNIFTTEALWQQCVSDYGVCGKFVYDSVNNTVRLPKITGIVEGTTDLTALGDLVEAGLPNITGSFASAFSTTGTGCVSTPTINNAPSKTYGASSGENINSISYIDASSSSSIYGNSTTVQPQTIKCFAYICIGTSSKTDIQVEVDDIATDLNGKMDTDLTNMSASQNAKNTIVSWGMPDYANKISFSFNDVNSYTTPSKGYISVESITMNNGADIFQLFINNVMVCWLQANNGGWDRESTGLYMVESGDVITYYGWAQHKDMAFYPMKGAN